MYDKFTIRECRIIPSVSTTFQPNPISELRLLHKEGDKEFDGNGPVVDFDCTLSFTEKEVWAKINVRMREIGGDHTTGEREYNLKLWACPSNKKIVSIVSKKTHPFKYTDVDITLDKYDFDLKDLIKHLEFRGDTDGDDLDLSDIESTGHLHKLEFNKIEVELINK
jgi:hypothetical protein